jgi:hypothetical protein
MGPFATFCGVHGPLFTNCHPPLTGVVWAAMRVRVATITSPIAANQIL